MWRSTDNGASFTQIRVAANESYDPFNTNNITSIESFPDGTLVCSRWSFDGVGGQIFTSTNKGATWSLASMNGIPAGLQMLRITIARAPSTTSTAYALAAASQNGFLPGIFRTTDNGRTWAFIPRGPSSEIFSEIQPTYNQILTVDPANANNIFVGGQFLYRSMDGGQNWAQFGAGHVDNHAVTWSINGSSKTLFIGNDGGLSIVRDPLHTPGGPAGVDLRRNRGLATHLIYGISSPRASSSSDAGYRIAIGLQDNGLRLRTDAGLGLSSSGKFDEWAFGDGYSPLYHPQNPDWVLGVINAAAVFRSTDNGRTASPSLGGITWGTPVVLGLGDPTGNTVFAISTSNVVYKTTDFGANWVSLPVTPFQVVTNIAASKSSPGTLMAMGSGGNDVWLALSRDNGTSWTPITSANPGNGLVRSILFDPIDANVLYATSASYDAALSHLWKSTDQGRTWQAIDGRNQANGFPLGIPVYVVRVDPTNSRTVYAGTDFGVYQSTDAGGTWARLGVGLPLVAARDLYLSDDGRLLRAGTYGRGVWELRLGGQNPPTVATAASATLNPVTGTTTTLSVLGADDGGEANLTYTWATTGTPPAAVSFGANGSNAAKNSTATFSKAGTYTLQVTITDQTNLTVTSAVTVTVLQTPSSVVVSPASATVATSATQQFTATARDQFGAALASQPTFTWSVGGGGTINASGLFTAGATAGGPFTVTGQSAAGSGTAQVTVTASNPAVYRINCGSSSAVSPFAADQYASGGNQRTVTNTIAISGISNPAPQAVYQSERYGTSTYTFPNLTPGGQYTVRLHFAELYQTASGRRVFNVLINGVTVLSNFDIYAAAGGNYRAVVREFIGPANASGQMVINFNTVTDNATIGGIEILPVASSTVYQIDCGSSAGASPFKADQYVSGGTQRSVTNAITISGITNPAPQAVYQSERYGASTYTFPGLTAAAQYTVRLHFAELYWTASGRRKFNVVINGTTVLSSFDIYASAGGNYRALVREFTTTANSSGQIVINLSNVTDNATIEGIEIIRR